mmetsp:Transcript_16798/g.43418  ORF Transcript_16798/g.43418 Transcript_16798/m.43418 type:complete len:472 (+) Transcript_16798:851-2266(+)
MDGLLVLARCLPGAVLAAVALRLAQEGVAVLARLGVAHAELPEALLAVLGCAVEAPDCKVHDGKALALEVLDAVGAVAVEEGQAVLDVELELVLVVEVLQLIRCPVVLRPVVQLTLLEVAESLDEGRAEVIAVAVELGRVVVVQIQGGPLEGGHVGRQPVVEPLVDDGDNLRVRHRRRSEMDVATPVPQEAHSIAPDPILAVGCDVDARDVLCESPLLQRFEHVLVADHPLLALSSLQSALRLPLRHQAMRAHNQGLAAALTLEVLDFEVVVLGELLEVPPPKGAVHIRDVGLVRGPRDIDGLLPERAHDLDKAALVVPAPVRGPASEGQCLADACRLRVLLVADMALAAGRLRVRPVGDFGLGHPASGDLVGVVPVAVVSADVGLLHVLGLTPLFRHADLEGLPLLRSHCRRGLGLLPALHVPRLLGLRGLGSGGLLLLFLACSRRHGPPRTQGALARPAGKDVGSTPGA